MSRANITWARSRDVSKLVRARFSPGMLLHHDDLEQLNTYTRELSRLMFRSLFGCGVVCGLVVTVEEKCGKVLVEIEPGLAIDCQGDPIHVPKRQQIAIDEHCDRDVPAPLWVVLCGSRKSCAPRTAVCASDEDESPSVWTREREGFEIRVVSKQPECACGCLEERKDEPQQQTAGRASDEHDCGCVDPADPCYAGHYAGECDACECCGCDGSGSGCDGCDCVVLARLDRDEKDDEAWVLDHRVRRFIRPVLMRDPQVALEQQKRRKSAEQRKASAAAQASGERPPSEAETPSQRRRKQAESKPKPA